MTELIRTDITRTDGPEVLFSHEELRCKATGVVRLHPGFGFELAALRMSFGRPMFVRSGCRSAAHNREQGGVDLSTHIWDEPPYGAEGTLGIDFDRVDGTYSRRLVELALITGWSVGIAQTFIHCDRRDLVGRRPVLWGYGNGGQST